MPADRDQYRGAGTSQPTGLWPGQDIPRQHGSPEADPELPWPDPPSQPRPGTPVFRSSLPWPPADPAGPHDDLGYADLATRHDGPGQGAAGWPADTPGRQWAPDHDGQWPAEEQPTVAQWPADGPAAQWPADGPAPQWTPGGQAVLVAEEWPPAGQPPAAGADDDYPPPPAGPDRNHPGPPLDPEPAAGGRRRWRLLLVAAVTLALTSTGVAVATLRDPDPATRRAGSTPGSLSATAYAPGQAAPSATPGGSEALGGRPASPSPSAAAAPGSGATFTGDRQTLPGASIAVQSGETFAQALSRSDRTFGTLKMARVFFPGLPPAWDNSRADVADRTVVVSFKASPQEVNAGKYDSRLAAWFRSIPRDHNVYWSYFHEPEDDVERGAFTAAAYRSAWRRIAGLANKADNPKLINTVILMCWTLDPKSKRDFDAFYPGGDLVETLGWDCYNWGAKWKRYAPPQEIYGQMVSKSRALGKPFGVAETGSDLVPGDSGTGRAAWIRDMASYLNGQRPEFVSYYNQVVSQGDFRLQDTPSIQAWRSFCTA
jgi:hypothetical protein